MPLIVEHCEALPVVAFDSGEVLLAEGASTGRLYVLIDGAVEILKGDLQINTVSDHGAILGDMSVLLNMPHMATVRATSPCRAHVTEAGEAFLQSHPEIAYQVARMLAHRLHGMTAYLVDLKRQYDDDDGHLGMVDEILETLLHEPQPDFTAGSDRDPGY